MLIEKYKKISNGKLEKFNRKDELSILKQKITDLENRIANLEQRGSK